MLALTPHVAHKILFERIQFAMFLQLLGALPPDAHLDPAGDFCPQMSSKIGPLGPKSQRRPWTVAGDAVLDTVDAVGCSSQMNVSTCNQ